MTANQISYTRAQEERRHNLAVEAETHRSNTAGELISMGTLQESRRSNLARERETNRSNVARETETHRANLAIERLGVLNYSESVRANKAREAEAKRSNQAREAETYRSNLMQEAYRLDTYNLDKERYQMQLIDQDLRILTEQARIKNLQSQTDLNKARTTAERVGVLWSGIGKIGGLLS